MIAPASAGVDGADTLAQGAGAVAAPGAALESCAVWASPAGVGSTQRVATPFTMQYLVPQLQPPSNAAPSTVTTGHPFMCHTHRALNSLAEARQDPGAEYPEESPVRSSISS